MNAHHKKPSATLPTLPVDVIVDILCRLPVKTLLRFRCLSKQFRSIINDPGFINRHLQFHSTDQRLILEGHGRYKKLLFLDLDSIDNAFGLELPFENWEYGFSVNVIGSCDGLLALSNSSDDSVGLWNISSKKHQILPKCLSDLDGSYVVDGFGRDAATGDFKFVRVANCFKTNVIEVSVYSLKANCWRRIDGFPPCRYELSDMAALVEGTLNWAAVLVEVEDRRKNLIVSFDLKNEFFFEVSLPDAIEEIEGSEVSVTVLGGCLCLLYDCLDQPVYDIWVMKEYGLKDSWTKRYSFSYEDPEGISELLEAFVYSNHGDKVVIFQSNAQVIKYDLKERKSEIVKINELPLIMSVSIYVDSLISPNVN